MSALTNWEQAKQALLNHFDHPDQRFALRQHLYHLQQTDRESVRQYADRFGALAEQLGEDESSEQLLSFFFNGLRAELQQPYRIAIIAKAPTTLAEASATAQAVESVSQSQGGHRRAPLNPIPTPPHANPNMRQTRSQTACMGPGVQAMPCRLCGKHGHSEAACFHRPKEGSSPKGKEPVTCFTCQKPGHISLQCPSRLVNNQTRATSQQPPPLTQHKDGKKLRATAHKGAQKSPRSPPPQNDQMECEEGAINDWIQQYHPCVMSRHVELMQEASIENQLEIRIVLLLNSKQVPAIIDTGCTHTLLDQELCQQLGIQIHPIITDIQLGGKDQVIPATGEAKECYHPTW